MSTVKEAAEELLAVLGTVEGVRVYGDLGANLSPPALLLGPPALGWRSFCGPAPTSARFVVFVVVDASARALEELWELVPAVATAVEQGMPSAAVQDGSAAAMPTTWNIAGVELPAYQLTIEVDL